MGYDELLPVTKLGKNTLGGMGATVIDSLDTLWLMGLRAEYERWVEPAGLLHGSEFHVGRRCARACCVIMRDRDREHVQSKGDLSDCRIVQLYPCGLRPERLPPCISAC